MAPRLKITALDMPKAFNRVEVDFNFQTDLLRCLSFGLFISFTFSYWYVAAFLDSHYYLETY